MNETVKSEIADGGRPATHPARNGIKRFSAVQFLIAIVMLFISFPFLDDLRFGEIIESILMTVVMVSGVMVVAGRRRVLWIALIIVVPVLVAKWLSHYRKDILPPEIFPAGSVMFVAFVVVQLLRFVFRAPRVNFEVLCAGISTYLLLGLLWTFAYLLVGQCDPTAFAFSTGTATSPTMTRFTAYYFSFVTLSTVGYGDVIPVSKAARELAVLEAITGTLFIAVLISRLVALHITQSLNPNDQQSGQGKD
jgi:voltage-gated potassium channel